MLSLTRRKTWHRQSITMYQAQNHQTKYTHRDVSKWATIKRQQNDGIHFYMLFQTTNPNGASMMQYSFHSSLSLSFSFFFRACVCVEQIIVTTNVPKCSRKPIHQHFDDDQQTASLERLWILRITYTNAWKLSLNKKYIVKVTSRTTE